MLRKGLLGLFLLLCLVIAGVAFTPASVIERIVNERLAQSKSALRLSCASGNVNSGGLQLVLSRGESQDGVLLAQINWRWHLSRLLFGRAAFTVTGYEPQPCGADRAGNSKQKTGQGYLSVPLYRRNTIEVRELRYEFSEAVVAQVMDFIGQRNIAVKLARPKGKVVVEANDCTLSPTIISAGAMLTASDVSLNTSLGQFVGRDLGKSAEGTLNTYKLVTQPPEDGQLLLAKLDSMKSGTQQIEATLSVDLAGRAQVKGTAKLNATAPTIPLNYEFSIR
jgi:hypothetical protein